MGTKMETGFLELVKAYEKAKPVVEKEENGVTPRFFVRVLVELEEVVNEQWADRDGRKKMSKSNAKSPGYLRQKHRKYIKDFEDDVKKFTDNPDAADDEDEKETTKDQDDMGDAGSDAEDNEGATGVPAADAFKKSKSKSTTPGDEDDEDSDDSYWDSDSDESSS